MLASRCAKKYRETLIEKLADFDDALAHKYLDSQPITVEEIQKTMRIATISLKFCPVFCDSSFKNKGIDSF